jgi:hypothetical protein
VVYRGPIFQTKQNAKHGFENNVDQIQLTNGAPNHTASAQKTSPSSIYSYCLGKKTQGPEPISVILLQCLVVD